MSKEFLVLSLIIFFLPWYYFIVEIKNIQKEQEIPRKIIYQERLLTMEKKALLEKAKKYNLNIGSLNNYLNSQKFFLVAGRVNIETVQEAFNKLDKDSVKRLYNLIKGLQKGEFSSEELTKHLGLRNTIFLESLDCNFRNDKLVIKNFDREMVQIIEDKIRLEKSSL